MEKLRRSLMATCSVGFMAMMTLLVVGGVAQAAPQYTVTCSSCHSMPPLDGATRNPDNGAFVGNHQTHQPAGASIENCALCHNAAGYTTSHMNGQISFKSALNASPKAGAQYYVGGSPVTFKNQTSIPTLGSCQNVNCHFESTTPVWGSATYNNADNDCNNCHSYPGPSGSHAKHDQYYTWGTNGCAKCHPDYKTGLKFSHATSAGNRGIKVAMTDVTSTPAYSGTGLNYLPSQSGARTFGNCSNLYCHSDGTKNTAYTTQANPAWSNAAGTLNCSGCHVTGLTLNTGSHLRHVDSTMSADFACYKCHAATVNSTNAVVSLADHVDRLVTVKYSNTSTAVNGTYNGVNASTGKTALTPGTRNATCTNIYCHSYGTAASGTFRVMSTARWGGAMPTSCTGCHGGASATNSKFRLMSTGKHNKHIRGTNYAAANQYYNYGCVECHNTTVSSNTNVNNAANHVNYKVDVSFPATWGGTYSNTGHKPGDQTGTCSNVYCHSNGQLATPIFRSLTGSKIWWGSAGSLGCSGCHGYGTTGTYNVTRLSGKHGAHLSITANTELGKAFACSDCHAQVRQTSWVDRNLHSNRMVNYSGTLAGKIVGDARGVTCANLYCHSDGKGQFKSMTTDNWMSGTNLNCTGCHGSSTPSAFTSQFGEPNYVSTGVNQLRSNSHQKHVDAATDCYLCHRKTVSSTTNAIWTHISTTHVSGKLNIRFAKPNAFTTMSGVYNPTARTCSTTYCHGTAASPAWGDVTTCATCHANQGAGTQAAVFNGAHAQHSDWATAGRYTYACENCHSFKSPSPAGHAKGGVSANQAAEVKFYNGAFTNWTSTSYGDESAKRYKYRALNSNPYGATAPTPGYVAGGSVAGTDNGFNWTAGTCSNVWCHSNANPVGDGVTSTSNIYATAPAWNTTITNCVACHGDKASTGSAALSPAHARHVVASGMNYGCVVCHADTVATDTTLNASTGIALHVNGVKDVKMSAGTYNSGTLTCSTTTCHATASPQWNAKTSGACGTCHLGTASTVGGLINTYGHFAHFSTVGASSKNYGPNYLSTNDTQCAQCHVGYTETAATHANGTKNTTLTTCTTACHPSAGMAAPLTAWTAGTVTCESCHVGTASVINSVTAPIKGAFATYGHGTGNIGAGKTGNACTDCHERNARHLSPRLGDNNRLKAAMGSGFNKDDNNPCTYCHNTTIVGVQYRNLPGHFTATLDSKSAVGCRNCHDPHGSGANSHMIKSQIAFFSTTTQAISFTGTEFVNTVTNRGLCQVCHRSTKYYRAGVPETVHFATNCLQCHTHAGGGIAAFAASACDSCHGYPPVARNVGYTLKSNIGKLGNYTGARFEDYSGGGGAHSVAAHVSPTARPSDGFTACTTCHFDGVNSHNGTTPVKSNIGNVTVKLTQKRQFKPGVQSIYTSAKFLTPPNNKTGTCYNLNCHFQKVPFKWSSEK